MKHYILYNHAGSGNHGCEALVRTTSELLNYEKNRISLVSYRPELDIKYGVDKFCNLSKMFDSKMINKYSFDFIKAYYNLKIKKDSTYLDDLSILNSIDAREGDIALSIGGDNYCYHQYDELLRYDDIFRRNGIKTVLWGCSVEQDALKNDDVYQDISKFELITTRETISYNLLKQANKNTFLVPDTAFLLNSIEKPMPDGYENGDIIGINLSHLAEKQEKKEGITKKNYEALVEFILSETNMKILMIPHVILEGHDDREFNNKIYEKYSSTNRIACIDDCSCEELKGYISRCKFFVGARTHATIAAYSSCIPTLVVGYSVKSKGIANDLFGTYDGFVIPVQHLNSPNDLLVAFKWIQNNEKQIKEKLNQKMPEYKKRVYLGARLVESL